MAPAGVGDLGPQVFHARVDQLVLEAPRARASSERAESGAARSCLEIPGSRSGGRGQLRQQGVDDGGRAWPARGLLSRDFAREGAGSAALRQAPRGSARLHEPPRHSARLREVPQGCARLREAPQGSITRLRKAPLETGCCHGGISIGMRVSVSRSAARSGVSGLGTAPGRGRLGAGPAPERVRQQHAASSMSAHKALCVHAAECPNKIGRASPRRPSPAHGHGARATAAAPLPSRVRHRLGFPEARIRSPPTRAPLAHSVVVPAASGDAAQPKRRGAWSLPCPKKRTRDRQKLVAPLMRQARRSGDARTPLARRSSVFRAPLGTRGEMSWLGTCDTAKRLQTQNCGGPARHTAVPSTSRFVLAFLSRAAARPKVARLRRAQLAG